MPLRDLCSEVALLQGYTACLRNNLLCIGRLPAAAGIRSSGKHYLPAAVRDTSVIIAPVCLLPHPHTQLHIGSFAARISASSFNSGLFVKKTKQNSKPELFQMFSFCKVENQELTLAHEKWLHFFPQFLISSHLFHRNVSSYNSTVWCRNRITLIWVGQFVIFEWSVHRYWKCTWVQFTWTIERKK